MKVSSLGPHTIVSKLETPEAEPSEKKTEAVTPPSPPKLDLQENSRKAANFVAYIFPRVKAKKESESSTKRRGLQAYEKWKEKPPKSNFSRRK